MNRGDIVRLKPKHHLKEFIKGDCIITEVRKFSTPQRRTKYHIKTIESDNPSMTWAYLEELDLVSELRNQKLESIGI